MNPKYTFYRAGKRVIAVSSFAGKRVRGVASCSEEDDFNYEYGMRLAQARCDMKVAEKREERALAKSAMADWYRDEAEENYRKAVAYLSNAVCKKTEAHNKLNEILKEKM